MKLSKLDPMTILMLVVAFGVVITMLTQNSVASVERTTPEARVNMKGVDGETMRVSYSAPVRTPVVAKNLPAKR